MVGMWPDMGSTFAVIFSVLQQTRGQWGACSKGLHAAWWEGSDFACFLNVFIRDQREVDVSGWDVCMWLLVSEELVEIQPKLLVPESCCCPLVDLWARPFGFSGSAMYLCGECLKTLPYTHTQLLLERWSWLRKTQVVCFGVCAPGCWLPQSSVLSNSIAQAFTSCSFRCSPWSRFCTCMYPSQWVSWGNWCNIPLPHADKLSFCFSVMWLEDSLSGDLGWPIATRHPRTVYSEPGKNLRLSEDLSLSFLVNRVLCLSLEALVGHPLFLKRVRLLQLVSYLLFYLWIWYWGNKCPYDLCLP